MEGILKRSLLIATNVRRVLVKQVTSADMKDLIQGRNPLFVTSAARVSVDQVFFGSIKRHTRKIGLLRVINVIKDFVILEILKDTK